MTLTVTPRRAAAARSCSALVSENSYMVRSMLCLACLIRWYTGENPACGSVISGPDWAGAAVPAGSGPPEPEPPEPEPPEPEPPEPEPPGSAAPAVVSGLQPARTRRTTAA